MKPSISRQCSRTSSRQRLRCDSGSDSRKMSSPCSEQSTGTRDVAFQFVDHAGQQRVGQVDDFAA